MERVRGLARQRVEKVGDLRERGRLPVAVARPGLATRPPLGHRVVDTSKSKEARIDASAHPVVLFDGVCNLCNAWVRWLVERDRAGLYRYASLQSGAARELLSTHLTEEQIAAIPDSIVLVDEAGVHTLSTAVLRLVGGLGLPWKALVALLVIPRSVRDVIYRFVASNRYRWFGRRAACMVPTPQIANRFLDAPEIRGPAEGEDPALKKQEM